MQTATQYSVSLVNKPGRLSAILAALSKDKVGIRVFSVMDSGGRGTLRLVADDPDLAAAALQAVNVSYDTSEVLLVEVNGQSGGLPKICQRLAEEHLNVDYAYGSLHSPGGKANSLAVIKVNDLTKAQRVLSEAPGGSKKRPGRRPAYAR